MKYINFPLCKPKSNIKSKKLVGFDIETVGNKNKFYMASLVNDDMRLVFYSIKDLKKFFSHRNLRGYTIVATNLQFDLLGSLGDELKNLNVLERKGRFIKADYITSIDKDRLRKITFIDTMNYIPASVEQLGKMVGVHKLDHPSFLGRLPETEDEINELEKYNINDSYISFKAMELFQNTMNDTLKCNLKLTNSSCSLDCYKRNYMKDEALFPHSGKITELSFRSYYGGRTEAIKRGHFDKPVNVYDYNSQYPSVMRENYPHPNKYKHFNYGSLKLIKEFEGFMYIEGFMPQHYIPSLPMRGEDKLLFPVMNIKGWYNFNELRYAIENQGFQINKFGEGVYYTKTYRPFEDFVNDMYSLRKKFDSVGNPMGKAVKIIMNSLYGKFAFAYYDTSNQLIHGSKLTMKLINEAKSIIPHGKEMFEIIRNFDFSKPKPYCIPIFSSYTTSKARILMNKTITNPKYWNHIVYMDTDSIFMKKGKELPTSQKLGDLSFEYQLNDLYVVRPKLYSGIEKTKAKGLGKMEHIRFKNIQNNPSFDREHFVKWRTAIKSKENNKFGKLDFNQIININKTVSVEDSKRWWFDKFSWEKEQDSSPQML